MSSGDRKPKKAGAEENFSTPLTKNLVKYLTDNPNSYDLDFIQQHFGETACLRVGANSKKFGNRYANIFLSIFVLFGEDDAEYYDDLVNEYRFFRQDYIKTLLTEDVDKALMEKAELLEMYPEPVLFNFIAETVLEKFMHDLGPDEQGRLTALQNALLAAGIQIEPLVDGSADAASAEGAAGGGGAAIGPDGNIVSGEGPEEEAGGGGAEIGASNEEGAEVRREDGSSEALRSAAGASGEGAGGVSGEGDGMADADDADGDAALVSEDPPVSSDGSASGEGAAGGGGGGAEIGADGDVVYEETVAAGSSDAAASGGGGSGEGDGMADADDADGDAAAAASMLLQDEAILASGAAGNASEPLSGDTSFQVQVPFAGTVDAVLAMYHYFGADS